MGFIGGYILPNIGITELDRKDAYYIIDDINFLADKTKNALRSSFSHLKSLRIFQSE